MRLAAALALVASTLLTGCVSSGAGRTEAETILAERLPIARGRPDDGETRAARAALLGRPLMADAAARLAVLHHPEVDAAFAEIGVARGQLVAAVTLPNPEVELEVKVHDGRAAWDLGASIDVTDLLRLASREAAASAALDAAAVEAVGRVMDVALEARRAWFRYVAARQVTELRRTAAFAFAQSADAAKRIYEAGNSPALPEAQERAGLEEARLLVARAELEELAARERLSASMGLFGEEAARWEVPARLPEPPAEEMALLEAEKRALERSLDLRALVSRHRGAANEADLASWGWLPHLSAGAVAEREEGDWAVGPQVGVEIPIFDHGQGPAAVAESRMAELRARLRVVATEVRLASRTLAGRLRVVREQVDFHRTTLLPLRQRVVDETLLQYNAMNVGVFQLLAARRDQVETGRSYVESLRDYWIARAELEQLLAGRLVAPSAVASGPVAAPLGGAAEAH